MMDDTDNSGATDDRSTDDANRRRFLKTIGALGVVGLAGCGGDGDGTDEPADTTEPMNTTAPGNTTEPMDTTAPADTTEPADTGTPTPTDGGENQPLGEDPDPLLSIEGSSLQVGESTILEGTLRNPYLFAVQNVEVAMEAPGDDWEVSPTGDTSFDTIASQGSETVGWEITAPEEADGEFSLEGTVSYETTTDSAEIPVSVPLIIFVPGEAPQEGLEAYFPLDGDTPVNQLTGNEADVAGASPGEASGGASGFVGDAWEFTANGDAETAANAIVSEALPINGEGATVGAWMYAEEVIEDYGRAFHVDEGGNTDSPTNGYNIEFSGADPTLSPQYWDGGSIGVDSGSAVPAPTGEWLFVVMVVEGDDCRYHTFGTDGELDGSPQEGTGTRGQSEEASLIMMAGDGRETVGRMDEMRAYSRALSEEEVRNLYTASGGTPG
jgi:hypothetical protein